MSEDKGIGLRGWVAGRKSKRVDAESRTEAVTLDKHRVAVLPLADMISDSANEYFSDGMTEELISTLANISGLTVISRTSIMQYKNASKKAVEIGRDLMAGTIIEGSVRKAGNRVRISVQLIDAQEDRHLWAENYDRELEDVFAVQADIARKVAEELKVKLLPRESAQMEKKATRNMEAYALYLKGRFQWNKRSRESLNKAIRYFQSSIDLDPHYALAYAGLADCYNVATGFGYFAPKDAYARAKKASLRALELDSNLVEAHAAFALTLEADWNWARAEEEYKRAIELNPSYASARQWYSRLLSGLGRKEEALAEAKKASETDPLAPMINSHLGWRFYEMGEYDRSLEQFKKVLEIEPEFGSALGGLAATYAKKSMFAEALAECQKLNSLAQSDLFILLNLADLYGLCGREDEARRILKEHEKDLDAESMFLLIAAQTYSTLGDKNKAIELLESGYREHNPFVLRINLGGFANISLDPRFIQLQRNIGLRK